MKLTNDSFPKKFKLVDDGHYGHKSLHWICNNKSIILYDSEHPNKELFILFDDKYQPTKSILRDNGIIKDSDNILQTFKLAYNIDPRYIINNCDYINLNEFSIDGFGYLIDKIEFNNSTFVTFIKFNSKFEFVKYSFKIFNNKYKLLKDQVWFYKIEEIK